MHNPVETLWSGDWGAEPDLLVWWLLVDDIGAGLWNLEVKDAGLFVLVSYYYD